MLVILLTVIIVSQSRNLVITFLCGGVSQSVLAKFTLWSIQVFTFLKMRAFRYRFLFLRFLINALGAWQDFDSASFVALFKLVLRLNFRYKRVLFCGVNLSLFLQVSSQENILILIIHFLLLMETMEQRFQRVRAGKLLSFGDSTFQL